MFDFDKIDKEPLGGQLRICKIFKFEAAHSLPHHEGKCKEMHGHSYKLEVEVTREEVQTEGPEKGMLFDFGLISAAVNDLIIEKHDHKDLNDIYDNPTAENMVLAIAKTLSSIMNVGNTPDYGLVRLRLWETDTCYAEWRAS